MRRAFVNKISHNLVCRIFERHVKSRIPLIISNLHNNKNSTLKLKNDAFGAVGGGGRGSVEEEQVVNRFNFVYDAGQSRAANGNVGTNMKKIISAWENSPSVRKLLALRQYTSGNHTTFFFDGSLAFQSLWSDIKSAKRRIWVDIYQISPDNVGLTTIQLLADAALRGVHVVLLYDVIGSYTLRDHHLRPLALAKATILRFQRPFTTFQLPWLGRNHKKLIIVDDEVAYCGGMNIGGDYAGEEVGGNGRFYDAHCAIRGPVHTHLVNVFLRSVKSVSLVEWERLREWCYKKRENNKNNFNSSVNKKGQSLRRFAPNVFVQVLDCDARLKRWHLQKALILMLSTMKNTCYIVTPYFLPPEPLKRAILEAAKRGVLIRLITQGVCKTPIISQASQHIYGEFLEAGVLVYQMFCQELHAKLMVIDDMYCTIGTFNFDSLSFQVNSEINLAILDVQNALLVKKQIEKDIAKCKLLTPQEYQNRVWWRKVVHWLAYLSCRLVFWNKKQLPKDAHTPTINTTTNNNNNNNTQV